MFITSVSEIYAIDLLTTDRTIVMRGLNDSYGMDIDTVDMKLYFRDGNNISSANFDGTVKRVILKNAKVFRMAIDWIGNRIFWTEYPWEKRIFVANLNGKGKGC